MPKYRNVLFLDQPQDFDTWYSYHDEDSSEGFDFLIKWEYGDDIPLEDSPPWGSNDTIEYFDDGGNSYAVSFNWNLQYVSLTEIIEVD